MKAYSPMNRSGPDLGKSCTDVCVYSSLCRWVNGCPMCHCIGGPSLRRAKSRLPLSAFSYVTLETSMWFKILHNEEYIWVYIPNKEDDDDWIYYSYFCRRVYRVLPVPTSYWVLQSNMWNHRVIRVRNSWYHWIPLYDVWYLDVFGINITDEPA